MSSEQLRTFTFWSLAVALAVAAVYAVYILVSKLRARRRPERDATWRELCLRLELIPKPGKGPVASGQLQGIDFSLHDIGAEWILELPLSSPVLPPGVVLISPTAWRIRSPFKLRPLRWSPAVTPPADPAWYMNREAPLARAEASAPFLLEAARATEAHAPLRVESRRLVHALRTGDSLAVSEVRDAVRALEATAQRWLAIVESHGLPRVTVLPPLPSASSLLRGVLAERAPRRALLLLNAGLPLTLGALLTDTQWLFAMLLMGTLFTTWSTLSKRRYGVAGVCVLMLSTTFGAPWFWARSVGRGTTPSVLSVRDAAQLPHRKAEFLRFKDAVVRMDLVAPHARGVVPVVAKDWTSAERVTVFAVPPPSEDQGYDTLEGTAVAPSRALRQAALNAALTHGFPLHAHVRFVDFSTHAGREVASLRGLSLLLWGFPNALWLGWVLVMWRRKFRESRREHDEAAHPERTHQAA